MNYAYLAPTRELLFVQTRDSNRVSNAVRRVEIAWEAGDEFAIEVQPFAPRPMTFVYIRGPRNFQQFLGCGYGSFLVGAPLAATLPDANQ
jgi:hypothetical protein